VAQNPDVYSGAVTGKHIRLNKRDFAPLDERLRSVSCTRAANSARLAAGAARYCAQSAEDFTDIAIEQLPGNIDFFQNTVTDALQRREERCASGGIQTRQ